MFGISRYVFHMEGEALARRMNRECPTLRIGMNSSPASHCPERTATKRSPFITTQNREAGLMGYLAPNHT